MNGLEAGDRVRLLPVRAGDTKTGVIAYVSPRNGAATRYAVTWDGGPVVPGYTAGRLERIR